MDALPLIAPCDGGRASEEHGCMMVSKEAKSWALGHEDSAKIHGSHSRTYLQGTVQAWMRSMSVVISMNQRTKSPPGVSYSVLDSQDHCTM